MPVIPDSLKNPSYFILLGFFLFGALYVFYKEYTSLLAKDNNKNYDDDHHQIISIERQPLVLGGQMVFGFGTPTESPYPEMPFQNPRPKFYVAIAQPDGYCAVEACGRE